MPTDFVQKFVVEVDAVELLAKYLSLAIETVLTSDEEVVVKVINRNKKNFELGLSSAVSDEEKQYPVILISGWYAPKAGDDEVSYFDGYGPWSTFRCNGSVKAADAAIEHVLGIMKKKWDVWGKKYVEKFGDGYNDNFTEMDGAVDLGIELRSCNCFPEELAISIVHIYYGK